MNADSLINFFLTVAIPILLAVAGGILAIRALPSDTQHRERFGWIVVFIFLGVVGLVLGFVQQVRTTTQEHALEEKAQERDIRQEGDVKYTQGELDSVNKVLGQIYAAGASGTQTISKALLQGALAATSRNNGVEPPAIERMTNRQLREKVINFVNYLRQSCADHNRSMMQMSLHNPTASSPQERQKEAEDYANRQMAEDNAFNLLLQQKFTVDATIYRDELLRRLGPGHSSPGVNTFWDPMDQIYANYVRATGTADYLERLAKQLPP